MKTTAAVTSLTKYRAPGALSRQLYERAWRVMPGGNTRHSLALAPYPIYGRSGNGCRITDVEGEERVDFLNNYTSLILGHAHPQVTEAVQRRAGLGTAFTMPTPEEVELAELITERVAYVEQIRFCNSGSEASLTRTAPPSKRDRANCRDHQTTPPSATRPRMNSIT